MEKLILYEDRSGVFGKWVKRDSRWVFDKEIDVPLDESDMKYLLKELKKIKKEFPVENHN